VSPYGHFLFYDRFIVLVFQLNEFLKDWDTVVLMLISWTLWKGPQYLLPALMLMYRTL
jgi:hypothetical protein